ncbi:hypothetical protein IAR50_004343 [Cryptococcus sp. DSM 104548]
MTSIADQLKKAEAALEDAKNRGSSSVPTHEKEVKRLQEELEKPQPHPALQFNEYAQCIAVMCALSLLMASSPLPLQLIPFYRIFSTVTMLVVTGYVVRISIIYYGYQQELAKWPKPDDPEGSKLKALMASKKPRPDLWAHTRSHPSAFLTTKNAQPRLFPFPLGKTKPEAAVKDELWWEGGNAPHVGHFNRPKLPAPPAGPDEKTLMKRVQASMRREAQENLWRRRIKDIQALSCIVIVSFLSKKIAAIALAVLIYRTVSSEIAGMLEPPDDMDKVWSAIDKVTRSAAKNESAPRPTQLTGGMTYLFEQDGDWVKKLANVPVDTVPPPVLMTTTNHWYAGPGNEMKG